MRELVFYDGSQDKRAVKTAHTVAATSSGIIYPLSKDAMTLRVNGREDWSLFYCAEGKMDFEGQTLMAGEAFLYPPAVKQCYRIYGHDRTTYAYLHFSGSCIEELFASLGLSFCAPIKVRKKGIFGLFSDLSALTLCEGASVRLRTEALILHLFSYLADENPEGERTSETSEAHVMTMITEKMAHCFADDYDVHGYAEMLHVSPDRFQHLFKDYAGVSPYAYYIGLRMENAVRLLLNTDLKIKAVAECSGYRDPFYFTQAFRHRYGVTPSAYRKIRQEK